MNARISVFVIRVKAIIYLLLYDLHDCTFSRNLVFSLKIFQNYLTHLYRNYKQNIDGDYDPNLRKSVS